MAISGKLLPAAQRRWNVANKLSSAKEPNWDRVFAAARAFTNTNKAHIRRASVEAERLYQARMKAGKR